MNTYTMLLIFVSVILIFTVTLTAVVVNTAYRNGVRDGYQNTFLPHVRKQVQDDGLTQGEEIPVP